MVKFNPVRNVEYILFPKPKIRRVLPGGIFPLNYIFRNKEGEGYRLAFSPDDSYSVEEISIRFEGKPNCFKFKSGAFQIDSSQKSFYGDNNGNVFLGDRRNPSPSRLVLLSESKTP